MARSAAARSGFSLARSREWPASASASTDSLLTATRPTSISSSAVKVRCTLSSRCLVTMEKRSDGLSCARDSRIRRRVRSTSLNIAAVVVTGKRPSTRSKVSA